MNTVHGASGVGGIVDTLPISLIAQEFDMNWNLDNVMTVAGYECPQDASPQTKRVLRRLSASKSGMIVFTNDDGFSAVTRCQLVEIAGFIGLCCFEESHRLILLDEEDNRVEQIFDGAQDIRVHNAVR